MKIRWRENFHMAVQDHLWQLVKKLDSREIERFLRKHNPKPARKKNKQAEVAKDYVMLFNDLLAVDDYDEKEFKKSNAGKPYLNSLPQMKRYLYDYILDFLREPKRNGSKGVQPEFMIREWLEEATVLRQRLLLPQCLARLEKAEQEARKGEFLELLLEVLKRKRTHINEATGKNYPDVFPIVLEEIQKVGAQIALNSQLIAYRDTFVLAQKINSKPQDPQGAFVVATRSAFAAFVLPDDASTEAKINFHTALAMQAHWENRAMAAWENYKRVYELWNAAPDFRTPRWGQYLKMLNNYLSIGIAVKQNVDFFKVISELNKTAELNPDDADEGKQNAVYLQLQYYMAFCDWDNCQVLEAEFKRGGRWVSAKMKKPRRVAFNLSFARFHFAFGRIEATRGYLQQLFAEQDGKAIPDRDAEARVLEFLMAWDQACRDGAGDPESLLHNIKSYLKRNKSGTTLYTALTRALAMVLKAAPGTEKAAYREGAVSLLGLRDSLSFDGAFPLICAWMQSQASGLPIPTILEGQP